MESPYPRPVAKLPSMFWVWLVMTLVTLLSYAILFFNGRSLYAFVWIVLTAFYASRKFKGDKTRARLLFLLPILTFASPIDVTVTNVEGPPRIVAFNDLSWGCMRSSFDPQWVVVW